MTKEKKTAKPFTLAKCKSCSKVFEIDRISQRYCSKECQPKKKTQAQIWLDKKPKKISIASRYSINLLFKSFNHPARYDD